MNLEDGRVTRISDDIQRLRGALGGGGSNGKADPAEALEEGTLLALFEESPPSRSILMLLPSTFVSACCLLRPGILIEKV